MKLSDEHAVRVSEALLGNDGVTVHLFYMLEVVHGPVYRGPREFLRNTGGGWGPRCLPTTCIEDAMRFESAGEARLAVEGYDGEASSWAGGYALREGKLRICKFEQVVITQERK